MGVNNYLRIFFLPYFRRSSILLTPTTTKKGEPALAGSPPYPIYARAAESCWIPSNAVSMFSPARSIFTTEPFQVGSESLS